jgi:hypothetical protein
MFIGDLTAHATISAFNLPFFVSLKGSKQAPKSIHTNPKAGRFLKLAQSVTISAVIPITSGSNSVVESRLPKPLVAGSIPVSRSKFFLPQVPHL